MKIILMILLSTCLNLGSSEYPRFKRKGLAQTGPPRPPPPQSQFGKKWGKPPQKVPPQKMPPQFGQGRPYQGHPPPPTRGNRPQAFTMHMGQLQQHPMLSVPKFQQFPQVHKGQQAPMKDFFKVPVQQPHKVHQKYPALSGQLIKFPFENNLGPNIIHKHQEKPSFHSSPSIPAALEYDYHIQTNSIPLSANTIKQVGEKGPIHTIPAPNLTPADKPTNYDLRKLQQQQQHHHHQYQQQQQQQQQLQQLHHVQPEQHQLHHQYQVTEPSEQFFREQINLQQQSLYNTIQAGHFGNQQQQIDTHGAPSMLFGRDNLGVTIQETANHGINIGFGQNQAGQTGQDDLLLSNTKHYQAVNAHFSTGQPNVQTQAIQSSYEQQQPQILRHFVQPETEYLQQYQQGNSQAPDEKNLNVEPEYHSFNYDEQAHQAQAKSSGQSSGLVTATYSLGSPDEIVKGQNSISRSSSVDPLTQAQIVQSYFDTSGRSGSNAEPDAKPGGTKTNEEEAPNTLYYTSLPNKEAAERLAKLQAAGKVNSSLMQIGTNNRSQKENSNNEMPTIFVPDDGGSNDKEDAGSKEQSVEYEDYAQDEDSSQGSEEHEFGRKNKY